MSRCRQWGTEDGLSTSQDPPACFRFSTERDEGELGYRAVVLKMQNSFLLNLMDLTPATFAHLTHLPSPWPGNSIEGRRLVIERRNRRQVEATDATILLAKLHQANCASAFANQLIAQIRRFDEALDLAQEVGMQLVSFGQSVTFHVAEIAYCNPSLIIFKGWMDNGRRVELTQHVSQISFLLIALPRLNPEKPKRKIGFIQENFASPS